MSGLRAVAPDLFETTPDSPFPGLTTHAYLWTPAAGEPVLFYSVASERDFDALADHGGVAHQYLSHRDEAGPMLPALHDRFGTVLHAPAAELDDIARHRAPDVLLDARGVDALGIDVVPTPGHSPGSTCFVVDGAAGRMLFTGDTLYRAADGTWTAGYLPGISDAGALRVSLDILATLRPDLVISSAFAGASGVHVVDPDAWPAVVEDAAAALPPGR